MAFPEVPNSFREELGTIYDRYFLIQHALSHDDSVGAARAAGGLKQAIERIHTSLLPAAVGEAWLEAATRLGRAAGKIEDSGSIEVARTAFEPLSLWIAWIAGSLGSATDEPILRYHCPMAFDWRGADWLQNKHGTENPYFGASMFQCGSEDEVIWAGRSQQHSSQGEHGEHE